jgi:hypothetical protein
MISEFMLKETPKDAIIQFPGQRISDIKYQAGRRGKVYELPDVWAKLELSKPCFYCSKMRNPNGSCLGFDRVDNDLGKYLFTL